MSPVDPRSISTSREAGTVGPGVVCVKCEYPLEGLPEGGRCPECGTAIRRKHKPGVQARDNLTDAPVEYLQRLRWSTALMALLGVANGGVQAASVFVRTPAVGWVLFVGGLAWAAVVFVPTRPRPFQPHMRSNPAYELRHLRRAARFSQLAWPLRGLCFLMMLELQAKSPSASATFRVLAAVLQFVGVLGFAPLSIWLAQLADWAQDTGLSGRFRISAVLVGVCGTLMTVTLFATALASGTGLASPLSIVAGLSLVAYEIGLLLFGFSQMQLAMLASWAVQNAKKTALRDQRVLERKARRTFTGQAAEGTALADMAVKRGEKALEPCAGCGYDLTGLPPGTRCPECGRMPDEDSTAFLRHPGRRVSEAREWDDIPLVGDDEPDDPSAPPLNGKG